MRPCVSPVYGSEGQEGVVVYVGVPEGRRDIRGDRLLGGTRVNKGFINRGFTHI